MPLGGFLPTRAADAWRQIGATDVTRCTSSTDIVSIADQIDALQAFRDRGVA